MTGYTGRVSEVTIGAGKGEGGSRSKVITIGGETSLSFFGENGVPNRPVVSLDVFDIPIPLPKTISEHYEDVISDPSEWAKKGVEKLGADMIGIHLVSTDPKGANRGSREAVKTVEEVLQAVSVPIVIGGSGNPQTDPEVLSMAAEVSEGERCLLNSVTPDVYKSIALAAKTFGHNVVAWTSVNVNEAKRLNKLLIAEGLTKDRIVMDVTTGALGYGLEYSFSIMERTRIAALKGDEYLQMPIMSAAANAWGAREAWSVNDRWGPRDLRGPLWEAITGITALLAGADLLFMIHPLAVQLVKDALDELSSRRETDYSVQRWIEGKNQ